MASAQADSFAGASTGSIDCIEHESWALTIVENHVATTKHAYNAWTKLGTTWHGLAEADENVKRPRCS